ncbi:MAG: ABC transporter permease [Saprospiraceae bacterium]|nr:ABC transporter permease [Candidatus Vicinibacter affinis]
MMLWVLAWRNIWRNKKQSFVLMAAIAIGVLCALFIVAFYYGMIDQRVKSVIQNEISHIQVHHPKFREEFDPKYFIGNADSIMKIIRMNPEVSAVAGRINIQGIVAATAGSSGILINGVNPDEEKILTGLNRKIVTGSYFDASQKNPVLISERLMSKLRVKENSKVVFTFQNADGEVVSAAFKVTGVFATNSKPYDLANVFVRLQDLQQLQGEGIEVNEIAMFLKDHGKVDELKNKFEILFPATKVETWMEISPEMKLLVGSFNQSMYIYMGIILLALAFGITNTMLMSVVQRTREFGMLLAFGMKKSKIFNMVMLETFLLTLCGLPLGFLMATIGIAYTHQHGINLSIYKDTMESFGYDLIVYPEITYRHMITLLILVFILVFISALGPARRALSFNPIEALRKI